MSAEAGPMANGMLDLVGHFALRLYGSPCVHRSPGQPDPGPVEPERAALIAEPGRGPVPSLGLPARPDTGG